jgi:hypothetical protein
VCVCVAPCRLSCAARVWLRHLSTPFRMCGPPLRFFGPCFFLAGVIWYPIRKAENLATRRVNATLHYEFLGAACVIRSYAHCWKTVTSKPTRRSQRVWSCFDMYTYQFDAPLASNLTSVQESIERTSCTHEERCSCGGAPSGCSGTFGGFSNRSFNADQQVDCWKPLPLHARASFEYACGNPSCHKLWDPAIELGEAQESAVIAEYASLFMLIIGCLGWVAWACQCHDWSNDEKGIKGNAREASKRQLERARSIIKVRKRSSRDATSTIVMQATAVTDVNPTV